jgi:hypothetical protein
MVLWALIVVLSSPVQAEEVEPKKKVPVDIETTDRNWTVALVANF